MKTDNFTVLRTENTSNAISRRICLKLLHKANIPNSTIKQEIPKLIEELKKSNLDSIWIHTYRSLEQFNHGTSHCTAVWNSKDSKSPTTLTTHDECIENDIKIKWEDEVIPDDFIESNQMSKGQYLKIVDSFTSNAKVEFERIQQLVAQYKETNTEKIKNKILKNESVFNKLLTEDYNQTYPPTECNELDQQIQNLHASIGNIYVAVNDTTRDENNIIYSTNVYLKGIKKNLKAVEYERKKVI